LTTRSEDDPNARPLGASSVCGSLSRSDDPPVGAVDAPAGRCCRRGVGGPHHLCARCAGGRPLRRRPLRDHFAVLGSQGRPSRVRADVGGARVQTEPGKRLSVLPNVKARGRLHGPAAARRRAQLHVLRGLEQQGGLRSLYPLRKRRTRSSTPTRPQVCSPQDWAPLRAPTTMPCSAWRSRPRRPL